MFGTNQNHQLPFLSSISFVMVYWFYLTEQEGGSGNLKKGRKKKIPWQVSIQIHFSLALLVMQQCNNVPLRYWRKKQKSITGLVFRRFGILCGEVERTDSKQTSESMCLSGFIDCCDQPQGYTVNKTCLAERLSRLRAKYKKLTDFSVKSVHT